MGPAPISTALLLASLLAVVLIEAAAAGLGAYVHLPRLWLIAAARLAQILAVGMIARFQTGGLKAIGLNRPSLLPGLRSGLIWSGGFAVAAGLLFAGLAVTGLKPLHLIRSPLPADAGQRILYFFVGGLVAPVFEELFFRGILFGYLRRWSVPAAVLISTAVFAAFHLPTIPLTQVVGGVMFAVAYHHSGSLITPITIHVLGNLAIFTLSLPWFQRF